jgi:hypothetical protein
MLISELCSKLIYYKCACRKFLNVISELRGRLFLLLTHILYYSQKYAVALFRESL